MDKERFWSVMKDVNSSVDGFDQQAVLEATRKKLMEFPAADIARWHQIKDVYMDMAYRKELWAACAATGTHCSDDGFIDFRSWLISQGREIYMQVLKDPDSLVEVELPREGAEFELYGYIAIDAYAQKKEIEENGLASILKDYWAWIGKEGQISAEAYLRTLRYKNDIDKEIDAHPLGEEEEEQIRAEVDPGPDIGTWNMEMLPEIVPRLCWRYNTGQGMDMT